MFMRILTVLIFGIALSIFAGCSPTRSIQGKWVFDKEFTDAQFESVPQEKRTSGLLGKVVAPVLAEMLSQSHSNGKTNDHAVSNVLKPVIAAIFAPFFLDALEGSTCSITRNEIITVNQSGSGETHQYQLI